MTSLVQWKESEEETSITKIEVLKEVEPVGIWIAFKLLGIWKGKYRGQKQKWFIVKFMGKDNEINLNTKHPEFIDWKWINYNLLPEVIVDFKKKVYQKLKIELTNFINWFVLKSLFYNLKYIVVYLKLDLKIILVQLLWSYGQFDLL